MGCSSSILRSSAGGGGVLPTVGGDGQHQHQLSSSSMTLGNSAAEGGATTTAASSTTASALGATGRLLEYDEEAEALPPKLLASLANLQAFDAAALQSATPRPLSLLSFLLMRPAAEAVAASSGLPYLPNLLGILCRIIRKEGSALQLRKLYVVQFLFCETQPGGCLYGLLKNDPLSLLAVCLSALTFDVPGIAKVGGSHRQSSLERGRQPSVARDEELKRRSTGPRQSAGRTTANTAQTRAVRCLLLQTAYFKALPESEASRLLSLVSETNLVGDPNTFSTMLNREEMMKLTGCEVHLLQATLVVACNSHLMRKFKVHLAWCALAMAALQGTTVTSDGATPFAFVSGDQTCPRFAKSQTWVIDNVVLPFMCLWARMVGGVNAKRLCHAASRTARTYEMTYRAPAFELGPGAIHTSVPVRLKAETSPVQRMIDTGNVKCPLIAWNRDQVAIPEDVQGALSVCRMYNINAEHVVVVAPPRHGRARQSI